MTAATSVYCLAKDGTFPESYRSWSLSSVTVSFSQKAVWNHRAVICHSPFQSNCWNGQSCVWNCGASAGKLHHWCSCYPTPSMSSSTEKYSALTKHIQSPTADRSLAALLCNPFTYIEFQISWSISKGEDGTVLSLKNEGRFICIRFTDRLSEWACAPTTAMLRSELEILLVHLSAGWLFKHFLYCWIPQRLRQSIDDEGQHLLSSP